MPQRDLDGTRDVEVGLRRLLGSRRGGAARRRDEHDRREDRRLQPHPIFPPRSGGLAPRPPRSGAWPRPPTISYYAAPSTPDARTGDSLNEIPLRHEAEDHDRRDDERGRGHEPIAVGA